MILVLGNATVDLSYEVERLPLPGETLLASSKFADAGGKGLNQAVVAHRAGTEVRFCAAIGNDANRAALGGLSRGDTLLMQGNLNRQTTHIAFEIARERGFCTILNPAPIAFDYAELWPLTDVAIVNEVEAAALGEDADVDGAALHLLEAGSRSVIVTLGAAGARLYEQGRVEHIPAPGVIAVDTTGAGDVFCGVLAAGLAQGMAMSPAIRWSVKAASLSVTRRGTGSAFPIRSELIELRAAAVAAAVPQ